MHGFIDIALGFPTVLWTALVTLVLAYWLFVILGALDLELLDFDIETDFDIDIDVDADIDAELEGDVSRGAHPLLRAAVALGIGKVPITILISFFALSGWMVSYFGALYLTPLLRFGGLGALILCAAFMLSIPMMGIFAHPLKGMFETTTRHAGAEVVGRVCTVSTGSVDDRFGQAKLDDGGAGLLLAVRCEAQNSLEKYSQALIIGHDVQTNVYFVEPYEQFLDANIGVDTAASIEAATRAKTLVNAQGEG